MSTVSGLYQAALVLAVLVTALAAGIAWHSRDQPGGTPLTVLLVAATVWAGATLAQTFWYGTPLVVFWDKVILTSVVVLVASFLVFSLRYTGRDEYVDTRTLGLLSIEPVVFTALVWTNESHHLVWHTIEFTNAGPAGVKMFSGPAYAVHTLYSYTLLALAVVLIIVFAIRSQHLYRRQVTAIVVASLVPWFANAVYQVSGSEYDPTPVTFTVLSLAFTWAVVREDFLDIAPVATELVFDTIDTAVFVVDAEGRVVEVNDSACDLLDVSTTEAVGSDARSLLDALPNARNLYGDVGTVREPTSREFHAGDQYLRLQVSPLYDRHGDVIGRVFLVVDLTEQRRREEQLEQRNDQLDQFAGVVSHDLRNPLEVASSSLELARETGAEEDFDRAQRAHERMDRLIEDLLSLARQETDRVSVEPVDVGRVAESAWDFVDTADATLSVPDDDVTVRADPDRLSQLFENLIRNAIEHGGDDVTVTVEPLTGADGFAIDDDGPGFDGTDPEDAFEDGYTTSSDGTGLGLTIVSEIADRHGWSVEASEAGDGGARIEVVTDESS